MIECLTSVSDACCIVCGDVEQGRNLDWFLDAGWVLILDRTKPMLATTEGRRRWLCPGPMSCWKVLDA